MTYVEESIQTSGARLYSRRREAKDARGEVIIVHGFAEHGGRYAALADHLISHCYSVTAYDQRGHGQSDGLAGHIDRFSIYEEDLDCVAARVMSRHPSSRLFLIGHSMGGLVALRHLATRQQTFAAAVISAPLLGVAVEVPAAKRLIARVAARLAPRLRLKTEIDPRVLSRDPEIGRAYAADLLVGKLVSARWFVEAGAAMKQAMEWAPLVSVPLLMMHGTQDRLASLDATKQFFERAGSHEKELVICPGYYHELFNEPEKQELFDRVTSWLPENRHQ